MERAKRRKLPLWLRLVLGVIAAAIVLALTAVGLRYWITSDPGRAFIVSQIDGRRVGPLGTLRVQGLAGDPLQAATLADIALVDDDGVWLRAKDARIEWTPNKLFGGELEIQAIQIRLVDVLRMPRTTYESERNPPANIGLKLDEILIDELRVAETIFKAEATYRISASLLRPREGAGSARLNVQPLEGPGDIVDASAKWEAEGGLSGRAMAVGPAGGLIASLVRAPENVNVSLGANFNGTIDKFDGDADFLFDDAAIASVKLSRNVESLRLRARLDAGRWPAFEALARRTGGPIDLSGHASLGNMEHVPVALTLTAPAGQVDLSTTANLDQPRLAAPVILSTKGLDLGIAAAPLTGKLDARGEVRLTGPGDFEWRGDAAGANVSWPSGEAARVTATLTVAKEGPSIYWETADAILERARITSLKQLAPARYSVATRGDVNLRTQLVEINQAQVRGAPGEASGRGSYTIETGAFRFAGAASLARLSDVAPLTGNARGQWTVTRSSATAPIRITADAAGRGVSSKVETLAELMGPSPNVQMSGVVHNGRFVLESGNFRGAGLNATMSGRVADNGAIAGRATGALRRPLDLPGARIQTLAFSANVSGRTSAPRVDLRLSNGALDIAGVAVRDVTGTADATFGRRMTGQFALTGGSEGERLSATGKLLGEDGDYSITNLNMRLAGVQLTAPELAYRDGAVSAAFDANGSLEGIAGLDRGTLAARGTLRAGENLAVDVSGQVANLRSGQLRVDLFSFDADAADDMATVKGRVRGSFGAPVDVAYAIDGRRSGEGWAGGATLDGSIDQAPVSTSRPASWSFANGAWSANAALTGLGGTIDATASSSEAEAVADVEVAGLDLRALTRLARITPIDGRVGGKSTFRNGSGAPTADMEIAVTNANPVGVTSDPVNINFTSRLRDGQMTLIAAGAGQGFNLEAGAQVRMIDGGGFNVVTDRAAPLQARLLLNGKAEQMWALFGPEGQALRGQLDADVRVAGTMAQPDLSGGFSMANGAYEHGETGLKLAGINAKGAFDQHSARLTELSAHDGSGGRLTGEGSIDWGEGLDGEITFSAVNLRALGRDDRFAIVSGDGSVRLDPDALRVTGDFDVSQARISIEQPASASIPTLNPLRRVNFPNQEEDEAGGQTPAWRRPVQLDLEVKADRRVVVFGRGLDTEWSADFHVEGPIANPSINGTATLVRGDLDLASRRFAFESGSINLNGPIRTARIDISAERAADDITARVRVTGSPTDPEFKLESTPALPQDEVLARVLFGRSASELSAFEAAQLAAGLTQLAGGQAGFDPVGLVRRATGLDRIAVGASGGAATVSAGKYIANDVYLQVGAGGEGGVGAEVEWEPRDNLSIISSAQGNGDTKIAVRWKRDY